MAPAITMHGQETRGRCQARRALVVVVLTSGAADIVIAARRCRRPALTRDPRALSRPIL
jgi:hypothetical protein